ncbi:MAG: SHOCT domain-containing protein [Verrucomicrobia bacterium]|nr:SHOCT domain-containing protein [Verrucomicrobiota bacterium]
MRTQAIALFLVIGSVAASGADVTLKVGDARGAPAAEAVVPVLITGSQKVGPIQFMLNYDPRVLEPVADGVVFGKVVSDGMISQNVGSPGELKIALRTDEPITQDGELLRVRFRVKGQQGDSCALTLDAAEAWEKESLFEVRVNTQPGTFTVAGIALPLPLLAAVGGGLILLALIALTLAVRRKRVPSPAPAVVAAAPSAPEPTPSVKQDACPQCGATVTPGDLFCGSCGRDMRTAAAAASRPPPAMAFNSSSPSPLRTSAGPDEIMAALKKLKEMQQAGLITAEDFERKKTDLLQRM